MFTVHLYTFAKKPNSTKQPGDTTANHVQYQGVMREGFDILRPSIGFQLPIEQPPIAHNYAYIPDFGRYYFITDWSWSGRLWYASMEVDVLATYKTVVGNSQQYIARAASEYNSHVPDGEYPATGVRRLSKISYDLGQGFPIQSDIADGRFVVGIIGKGSSGNFGAVTYYVMTPSEARTFFNALLDTINWAGISATEISDALQKALVNPMQYVTSCRYFPLTFVASSYDVPVSSIPFGYWSISASAHRLGGDLSRSYSARFALSDHPQAAARGKWLNMAPYTTRFLFLHPFGAVAFEQATDSATALHLSMEVDWISGEAVMQFKHGSGSTDGVFSAIAANISVDVPLAQISQSLNTDMVSSIGGFAMSAITGDKKGMLSGGLEMLGGAASQIATWGFNLPNETSMGVSMSPSVVTYKGGDNSPGLYSITPYIASVFEMMADDDNENRGRPLCEMRTVSACPGFVMVARPVIATGGMAAEDEAIRTFMTGGFYYE